MARTHRQAEAIAYHEAGHAVMAVWYGAPVRDVTVIRSQEYLGVARWSPDREDFGRSFTHRLVVAMSGLAAEAELTGKVSKEWWSLGARRDVENVVALLRPLIRKNWFAIQAVAEALLVKKTLPGNEVAGLVRLAESVSRLSVSTLLAEV